MKLCFFAQARQLSGCEQIELELSNPITAGELWRVLDEKFPGIAKMQPSTRLARNHEFATNGATFSNTDEVALIPTVSGG